MPKMPLQQGRTGCMNGQDFADIDAYGAERWLGELALALQAEKLSTGSNQTSVHTEGQRQTPAAGHLELARSVCMTAAMLGAGTDL